MLVEDWQVIAPVAFNPIMAKLAEAARFEAIEIEDQILPKCARHYISIEHMMPQVERKTVKKG